MPTFAGPGPVPFPTGILDLEAELFVGNQWQDITQYVYSERSKPTITRGRPDETSGPVASSCAFQLNNRDFRFSMHNPLGAYYPNLGRNTPYRMSIPEGTSYLRLENDNASNSSAPWNPSFNLPGDLEARIDLDLTNFTASTLCGQWKFTLTPGDWAWELVLNADGTLGFWYTTDGSTIGKVNSTIPLPYPGGRFSIKVTYAHTPGNVAFYYSTSIDGSYTQLGTTVTGPFSGVLFASDAFLVVGSNNFYFQVLPGFKATTNGTPKSTWVPNRYDGPTGKVYEFRLYNGIGGVLVAAPKWSAQFPGTFVFPDGLGNFWTCAGTSLIEDRKYRYHGEMSQWPARWDYSGNDVFMDTQANGLLRRIGQNTPPLDSALTRAWKMLSSSNNAFAPIAYWPCEDGNNVAAADLGIIIPSTGVPNSISSGLPSLPPMTLEGIAATPTSFAASNNFPSSYAIPTVGTQTWNGPIPAYTFTGNPANVYRFLLSIPPAGDTNGAVLMTLHTTGTVARMDCEYNTASGGQLAFDGLDSTGAQVFICTLNGMNGKNVLVELALIQSGSSVNFQLSALQLGSSGAPVTGGTLASSTVGKATNVQVNPNGSVIASAIGQIAVMNQWAAVDSNTSAASLIGPYNAWNGEPAGVRFQRLCTEQGFGYRIIGAPAKTVAMGYQQAENFISLLTECEAADHGMIFEPRESLTLGYRCYNFLVNQGDSISVSQPVIADYEAAMLGGGNYMAMEPTDDDLLTINDETVTRSSGSVTGSSFQTQMTAAQYAASSALSVNNPPLGAGNYADSRNVNVAYDAQLGDQAGWVVHEGTVNELRYPSIPFDLARSEVAGIRAPLQDLDIGDYLQVINPPPWLSYDPVNALIWGLTEVMGGYIYTISYQTQPESLWEVLVATTPGDAGGGSPHGVIFVTSPGNQSNTQGVPI